MKPRIATVQEAVAHHYKLGLSALLGQSRERVVARPRQLAMLLTHELTDKTLPEIGRAFSRDHTTIIHGIRVMRELIAVDPELADDAAQLRAAIGGGQ